jgi:hypothetical protein
VVSLFILAGAVSGQRFSWRELDGRQLELRDKGSPVLVMNVGDQLEPGVPEDRRRCCYIHPLYSPAGVQVTGDFPKDHYHHRGLFWAWPVVATPAGQHDLWMLRGIRPRAEKIHYREGGVTGRLCVSSLWMAGETPIVRETVTLMAFPVRSQARDIDLKITLEALSQPVTLRGSKEKGKAYGGVSMRFAEATDTEISSSDGIVPQDEDLVPHRWAELEATYDKGRAAVRIDSHPANPGEPNVWCLRRYGFAGASFPGPSPFVIEAGQSVALRYRITIEDQSGRSPSNGVVY